MGALVMFALIASCSALSAPTVSGDNIKNLNELAVSDPGLFTLVQSLKDIANSAPTSQTTQVTASSTAGGCTQSSCVFSYTNPPTISSGRCGEVDAAHRLPADIFSDPKKLHEYIAVTIAYYPLIDPLAKLKLGHCERAGYIHKGTEYAPWAPITMMSAICPHLCHCQFPACPDKPDDPQNHQYCSLCGPRFNSPIVVNFFYPTSLGNETTSS